CEFELMEGAFLLTQDDIDYINEFDNLPPDLTEEELIARIHEATGDAAEVIMAIASSLAPVPKVGLLKYARNLYKANKAIVAAKRGIKAIQAGNYTFTKTAVKHLATRPYMNSPSTITNIIKSGKGVPDQFFKGGMNYKVPGTFNGSEGVYELGINFQTNTIYHFLFKTVK
ncbi:MAG: hypothetical protein AAGA02_16065, partial [Bacteroidota bacterium]